MKRRVFGGLFLAGLAGCAGFQLPGQDVELVVHNETAAAHTGRFTVENRESGQTLHTQRFQLDAMAETAAIPLSGGTRLQITFELDNGVTRTFYYSESCREATLNIVIRGPEKIQFLAPACD